MTLLRLEKGNVINMEEGRICTMSGSQKMQMETAMRELEKVVKDSDDQEAKKNIKVCLQSMSEVVRILVIGDQKSGRTTLWKSLLLEKPVQKAVPTIGIEEIRFAEQEAFFEVESGYTRRFVTDKNMIGLAVFDIGSPELIKTDRFKKIADTSEATLIVLPADNIQCPEIWDYLERESGTPRPGGSSETSGIKKPVFILSKTDLYPGEEIDAKIEKVKLFMEEAGISAPIFAVSAEKNPESLQELREFIAYSVTGQNPLLKKQQENVWLVRNMLSELKTSFGIRYNQFQSDYQILEKIDRQLNTFRKENQERVNRLKEDLRRQIDTGIEDYEKEIITRLNPKTLKERFKTKEDFQDYLELVNQNYQDLLNKSVERKVQSTLKMYLNDLESVYESAERELEARPVLMQLEDRFYGSLAASKQAVVRQAHQTMEATYDNYKTLSNASEELFLKIWSERNKYDRRVKTAGFLGSAAGLAGGVAGATTISGALGSGLAATVSGVLGSGALAGAVNTGLAAAGTVIGGGVLIPVMALAGAVAVSLLAKKLAAALASPHMEREVEKCIGEFRQEVSDIRERMTSQVFAEVEQLFERELDQVDKSFLEFRMSTNIDASRLPGLKIQMQQIEELLGLLE